MIFLRNVLFCVVQIVSFLFFFLSSTLLSSPIVLGTCEYCRCFRGKGKAPIVVHDTDWGRCASVHFPHSHVQVKMKRTFSNTVSVALFQDQCTVVKKVNRCQGDRTVQWRLIMCFEKQKLFGNWVDIKILRRETPFDWLIPLSSTVFALVCSTSC